jgi:hypothetical protein
LHRYAAEGEKVRLRAERATAGAAPAQVKQECAALRDRARGAEVGGCCTAVMNAVVVS